MENEKTLDMKKPGSATTHDSPRVLVFPPALLIGTLLLGLLLSVLSPWPLFTTHPAFLIRTGAGVLAVAGASLVIWGRTTMVRAGTNVPPHKPTLAIVTASPFRFTRNPLYLGGTLVYFGLAIVLGSAWLLLLLAPMVLVLQWGIIHREERYLESKFGEIYVAYKSRVRQWF
jgi:protein-S-isoprenylcysteine O-methyltransferase Ste14